MTTQMDDYLFDEGRLLAIQNEFVLEPLIEKLDLKCGPEATHWISSGCWRHHVAILSMLDNQLFVLDVRDYSDLTVSIRWLTDQPTDLLYAALNAPKADSDYDPLFDTFRIPTTEELAEIVGWMAGNRQKPLKVTWFNDFREFNCAKSWAIKAYDSTEAAERQRDRKSVEAQLGTQWLAEKVANGYVSTAAASDQTGRATPAKASSSVNPAASWRSHSRS